MEITSQQTGKRAEFLVFGELVRRGADLYLPVIDTGIDAIVRQKDGTYKEIQVKSTEKGWSFHVWFSDKCEEERLKSFFVVCVDMSKQPPETWIFPSKTFKEYATEVRRLEGYTHYRLDLSAKSKRHENRLRSEILQEYSEAWELLTGGTHQR